jgi:hypothetical protein
MYQPFLRILLPTMATLLQRIATVLSEQQSEIASLRQQLSEALADDAADEEAVEAAKTAAAAAADMAASAKVRADELQALVDADGIEDQAISDLLNAFEPAAQHESEDGGTTETAAVDSEGSTEAEV